MKISKAAGKTNEIVKTNEIAKISGANYASGAGAPARCGQCNKMLRHLPFAIDNMICRECYGLDRYRRQSLVPPGASAEPVVAVAPRTAIAENPAPKPSSSSRRTKTESAKTA
jgi:hypothetical protein